MKPKIALVLIAVAALVAGDEVSQAATARFSGYTWVIRQPGRGGPGPNNWEPGNVLVGEALLIANLTSVEQPAAGEASVAAQR